MNLHRNSGLIMCLLTNFSIWITYIMAQSFTITACIQWLQCMPLHGGVDIYAKMETRSPGHSPGHSIYFLTEASDLAPRGSENQNCGFQGLRVAAVTPFVVWVAFNFLPPPERTLKPHLSTPPEDLWKSVLIVGLLSLLRTSSFSFFHAVDRDGRDWPRQHGRACTESGILTTCIWNP